MIVMEIVMPVVYTLILVVFRATLVPDRVPVTNYIDIPVNNLDILMWVSRKRFKFLKKERDNKVNSDFECRNSDKKTNYGVIIQLSIKGIH